jgi:uncharacterized protein (TIGR03437 family)
MGSGEDTPRCVSKVRRSLIVFLLLCNPVLAQVQPSLPAISALVNGATGLSSSSVPVAARGSIVTIYGSNLATANTSANGFPLPTQLGGTQVSFGGIPAPLLFVSASQINAQVPFEIPDVTSADVVVQTANGVSAPLKATMLAQDPGIFVAITNGLPVSAANPVS